jgi:ubiquitin C-terminal hydrolase
MMLYPYGMKLSKVEISDECALIKNATFGKCLQKAKCSTCQETSTTQGKISKT